MQIMAFDFGSKKIGIAFGQSITASASPLAPLRLRQQQIDWSFIEVLIAEWQPQALLVGLPLNMDGSASDMSRRCQRFARQLEGRFHLPTHLIDERLSTRAARERIGKAALSGRDSRVDSVAACIMIENFFNHQQGASVELDN